MSKDYPIDWKKVGKLHIGLAIGFIFISLPYFAAYPERIMLEWKDLLSVLIIAQIIFLMLSVTLSLPKDHFKKATTNVQSTSKTGGEE